jgi:hypothetical protein
VVIIIDMVEIETIIITTTGVTTGVIEITTTTGEITTKITEVATEMKDTPKTEDMTEMIEIIVMGGMKTNQEGKDNKALAAAVTVRKSKRTTEESTSIKTMVMKFVSINTNTINNINPINTINTINIKDGMVEEMVVITIGIIGIGGRMIITTKNIKKGFTTEGKGIRVIVMTISKELLKGKDVERTHLRTKKKIKDLNEILVISSRNKDQDQRFKTNRTLNLKIRKFKSSQINIKIKIRSKLRSKS